MAAPSNADSSARSGSNVRAADKASRTYAHAEKCNLRHNRLLQMLADRRGATVGELAAKFCTSEITIRRDLVFLKKQGLITRTHGGAVLSSP